MMTGINTLLASSILLWRLICIRKIQLVYSILFYIRVHLSLQKIFYTKAIQVTLRSKHRPTKLKLEHDKYKV